MHNFVADFSMGQCRLLGWCQGTILQNVFDDPIRNGIAMIKIKSLCE